MFKQRDIVLIDVPFLWDNKLISTTKENIYANGLFNERIKDFLIRIVSNKKLLYPILLEDVFTKDAFVQIPEGVDTDELKVIWNYLKKFFTKKRPALIISNSKIGKSWNLLYIPITSKYYSILSNLRILITQDMLLMKNSFQFQSYLKLDEISFINGCYIFKKINEIKETCYSEMGKRIVELLN